MIKRLKPYLTNRQQFDPLRKIRAEICYELAYMENKNCITTCENCKFKTSCEIMGSRVCIHQQSSCDTCVSARLCNLYCHLIKLIDEELLRK